MKRKEEQIDELFVKKGPTSGVYSFAYALKKLGVIESLSHEELKTWAEAVSFVDEEGHQKIKNGCDPVLLTKQIIDIIANQYSQQFKSVKLYFDINAYIEECQNAHTEFSKEETEKIAAILEKLKAEMKIFINNNHINASYDFHDLNEKKVCIGLYINHDYQNNNPKSGFLRLLLKNPTQLYYMMCFQEGNEENFYDPIWGYDNAQEHTGMLFQYTGIAIVLEKK